MSENNGATVHNTKNELLKIKREITGVVGARADQQATAADSTSAQVAAEERQKALELKVALHKEEQEARYRRAMLAMQEGPINVISTAKGVVEHVGSNRSNPDYVRADIGVINGDALGQNYFIDLAMDYGPSAGNPDLKVSRKVRVVYNSNNGTKDAYKILVSDPDARRRNREAMEQIKANLEKARSEANEAGSKPKKKTTNFPDSDFTEYKSTTSDTEVYNDILSAFQQARLTFDYREELGRPDNMVESRQIVWDNKTESTEVVKNGK